MNHRPRLLIWIGLTVFVMVLTLLPAVIASATTGTMQITTDTTLTEDHSGSIEVIADNVTLDCAGHAVVGSGTGNGITVHNQVGVTVRNCDVSGFDFGISLGDAQGSTIEKNKLHHNTGGFLPVGLMLGGSSDNTITGNEFSNNKADGLHVGGGSDSNLVSENVAFGNGRGGLDIHHSKGNIFSNNESRDNHNNGFVIAEEGATGNTLTGNVATGNGESGFVLWMNADSNVLKNNHAEDNESIGFYVGFSGDNLLEGNHSIRNRGSGFGLGDVSLSNTLKRNVAEDNDASGFFMDEGVKSTSLVENQAHRNGGWGFEDATTGSSYVRNYCTANVQGASSPYGLCQEEQVGLVDTSRGVWHLRYDEGYAESFFYGNPGDVPFLGDWDCDGNATPGLFRTSDAYAYLRNSNSQGIADIRFFFGNPSDIPLAGDFNGDGCDTLSIYRPFEARFYVMNKLGENEGGLGAADYSFLFGNMGDKPVVGDWDGDGIDEIGLHREATGFFYYRNTLTTGTADGQFFFGDAGDRFVAGDWGVVDGVETPAMFRPSNSTFYFRHTLTQGNADSQFTWTGAGMNPIPVAGAFTLD